MSNLNRRPLIIGVDPGLSGALTVLNTTTMNIVSIKDVPTLKRPSKARKRGYTLHIDCVDISLWLDRYACEVSFAVVEEPGAMPNQGLGSTFNFGKACGQLEGVLGGHNIPVVLIKPSVWKVSMGIGSAKNTAVKLADRYFPGGSKDPSRWKLKKHHDRAESALLAVWGVKNLLAGIV